MLVPIAILGGIGALAYLLVRGGRADDAFSSRTLLRAYLRIAYMVSLVVFLVGLVNVLTAGFALAFGHDFSYQAPFMATPASCPPPGPNATAAEDSAYQQCLKSGNLLNPEPKDTKQQDDLIRGLSLMVSGIVIGAGHHLGLRAVESPAERRDSGLARTELVVGTLGFGLVAIVALPLAAYSVLHHAILGNQMMSSGGPPDAPGSVLATAVVFLPAWLFYLFGFVRRARRGGPATEPAAQSAAPT